MKMKEFVFQPYTVAILVISQITVLSTSMTLERTSPSNEDFKVFIILSCNNLHGKLLLASSASTVTCFIIMSLNSSFPVNFLPNKSLSMNCSHSDKSEMINTHNKQTSQDLSSFCLYNISSRKTCCNIVGHSNTSQHHSPVSLPSEQTRTMFLQFPESEHVNMLKHELQQNEKPVIMCCKCNASLFKLVKKLNLTKNSSSLFIENKFSRGQKVLMSLSRILKNSKLCRYVKIVKNMTFESNQNRRRKSRWKRDGDGKEEKSNLRESQVEDNRTVRTNTSSGDFNSSYLREFYEERLAKKQLQFDAESAAICLVFISCLILFSLWYFRGFHNRNIKYREVTFHDSSHVLTVEEVLFRKRHYLPMFNQEDKLEEVFVHDCGNDP